MHQQNSLRQRAQLHSNEVCSQDIYQLMIEGNPYHFEHLYTKNELASLCMHLTDKKECLLQALYLMQAEAQSKRLGYVLEVYWALSQSYLRLNHAQILRVQVFSVESSHFLACLSKEAMGPVVIELTDAFLEAVAACKSWHLKEGGTSLSALGLMKRLLHYQMNSQHLVYFVFIDSLKREGLDEGDYESLLTPPLTINLNLFNKIYVRRLAVSSLRILNRIKEEAGKSPGLFTLNLRQTSLPLRKKQLDKQLKDLADALSFSSRQLAQENKLASYLKSSRISPLSQGRSLQARSKELSQAIREPGHLSEKIVAWTDEEVTNLYRLGLEQRHINRCVRLHVDKDRLTLARLLEEYQRHWKEGVYLSTLLYTDSVKGDKKIY